MNRIAALVGLAFLASCGGGGGSKSVLADSSVVFNGSEINDFRLTMSPTDWDTIVSDPEVGGAVYFPATMEWKGEVLSNIGVQSTADLIAQQGSQKMSLQLKFNEFVQGQRFHGLTHLKIRGMTNDVSMMRERLSFAVFQDYMPAPRSCHGRLFVNGDLKGLYDINEKVDKVYAKSRYAPGQPVGDLYHVWGISSDQYLFVGSNPDSYVPFPWAPRTNDDLDDPTPYDPGRVVHFLDVINNSPALAGTVCDLDALLELLAVEAAMGNPHGVVQDKWPDGHWQYWRPDSGLFTLIPWNYYWTWNILWAHRSLYYNFMNCKLTSLVVTDPVLAARYRQKIADVMAGAMRPDNAHALVDAVYQQIKPFVYEDPYKPYSNQDWENEVASIHDFVDERYAYLQVQIGTP